MQTVTKEIKKAKRSLIVEKLNALKELILTQPDNLTEIQFILDEILALAKHQKEVLRLSDDILILRNKISNTQLDKYFSWLGTELYKIYEE